MQLLPGLPQDSTLKHKFVEIRGCLEAVFLGKTAPPKNCPQNRTLATNSPLPKTSRVFVRLTGTELEVEHKFFRMCFL